MLYINSKTHTISIPIAIIPDTGSPLFLENTVTHKEYSFVLSNVEVEGHYLTASFQADVEVGEYVYRIGDNTGLLVFGDYHRPNTQYEVNNERLTYERN